MTAAIAVPAEVRPALKGWSHVVAAIAATALCPIVIALAPDGTRWPAAIFAAGVIALFAISATYHRGQWGPRWHGILQRLDHSMIFIVIAAIYTPIASVALPETKGRVILAVVWAGASLGTAIHLAWRSPPRWLLVSLYLMVGWVALAVIVDVWKVLGVAGFILLVAGGLFHSIGAVIYARRSPDPWPTIFGFHELFHLFVIAGISCHYIVVVFFALR